MARNERRKQERMRLTLLDAQKAISIALEMIKESRGHLFSIHLKERCVFCGVGRKTKKECKFWLLTFLDRYQTILINPTFFRGADERANWLQHGEQYQTISVPPKEEVKTEWEKM